MAEVYENPVILVILVMEGVDRAALCSTALTLDGLGQVKWVSDYFKQAE